MGCGAASIAAVGVRSEKRASDAAIADGHTGHYWSATATANATDLTITLGTLGLAGGAGQVAEEGYIAEGVITTSGRGLATKVTSGTGAYLVTRSASTTGDIAGLLYSIAEAEKRRGE